MLLAPAAKTKRFLELVQLLLTSASVCAVVASCRIEASPADRPGYHSGVLEQRGATRDRRFGDLARTERKRREAEQQANRRGVALGLVASANAAEVPALAGKTPLKAAKSAWPRIPVFAQVVAFQRHCSPIACGNISQINHL